MSQIKLGNFINSEDEAFFRFIPKKTLSIHIFGITGSRKTSLQLHMIENLKQLPENPQIVILSREGDEIALRNDIDLILVGNEGEIPIDIKFARQLGEHVRKQHADIIIDLGSLKTEREQEEYIAEFLDGLMLDRERRFWKKPCVVMIDEVQLYCNSSASKSRDAIVRLVTLGRKRSIVSIFASHQLKDFYWKARNDVGNVIIGYLKDPEQRENACKLLLVPKSEVGVIAGFQNEPLGRFYSEGTDIVSPARVFILQNKPCQETDEIPRITIKGTVKAKALMDSLAMTNKDPVKEIIYIATKPEPSHHDMSNEDFRAGYFKGWTDATDDAKVAISELIEQNKKHIGLARMFRKPTETHLIKVTTLNGLERLEFE